MILNKRSIGILVSLSDKNAIMQVIGSLMKTPVILADGKYLLTINVLICHWLVIFFRARVWANLLKLQNGEKFRC